MDLRKALQQLILAILPNIISAQNPQLLAEFFEDVMGRYLSSHGDINIRSVVLLCSGHDHLELCLNLRERNSDTFVSIWEDLKNQTVTERTDRTLFLTVSPEVLLKLPEVISYSEMNAWYVPDNLWKDLPAQVLRLGSLVHLYKADPDTPDEAIEITDVYAVKGNKDPLDSVSMGLCLFFFTFRLRAVHPDVCL